MEAAPVQSQKSPFAQRKSATKNPKNCVIGPASGFEKKGPGSEEDSERSAITWERISAAVPPYMIND